MEDSIISKPRLFALLIGINNYEEEIILANNQVKFPKLRGCVSDAQKIADYLNSVNGFELHIEKLVNENATKAQIVNLFYNHLSKAEKNDVVFFYFSGHGTQEFADKSVFDLETDGRLENIVCYYTGSNDDFLLADKELRWLIHKISLKGSHIVTIFDCCHSGDVTRNGYLLNHSFDQVVEKRIAFVFPQRQWEQFIFSKEFPRDNFIQIGEQNALPEGKHFQFAACESDESAVEISGEAVFTNVLLKVLNSCGGDITYYSLSSRIRQYMSNVYEQKPKLYIANQEPNDIYKSFLNKQIGQNKMAFGEVTYNESLGWQLNLGAIHGIGNNTPQLKLFDSSNSKDFFTAKITSVNVDSSILKIDEDLDNNKVYQANVEGLTGQLLRVHFNIHGGELSQQREVFEYITSNCKQLVSVNKEEEAQYSLELLNERYYITFPNDKFRPLVKPINVYDDEASSKLAEYFNHISKWESLKNLSNQDPETLLSYNALEVEILVGSSLSKEYLLNNYKRVDINYEFKNGKWKDTISIRLSNKSNRNLYCSVLYLLSNFASYSRYLNPPVKMLMPGESVDLRYNDSPNLNIGIDEIMKWYNWKEQTDYFKIIVSTENFDSSLLDFQSLPTPHIPVHYMGIENEYNEVNISSTVNRGWFTKQVELNLKNPLYNQISDVEIEAMLNDSKTADFAVGLYFETKGDSFSDQLEIKPILKQVTKEKKGFLGDKIIDLANWWSRRKRNQFYQKKIQQFPSRIKIVSEGDSWFQHPLVLDIIDHLHRVYNIYCVAAAGDTLRNYFSNEKNNGEYFLDALDKHNPEFFLISGGGNDILGSQFRNYLIDDSNNSFSEGDNPSRFLKNELFKEFDSLMEIYKSLFLHLKTYKSKLKIVVHGYDYPIKLNDATKGWLGRYMIEKGISRPGDRRAIIHLIMDTFNSKLNVLCKEFDNVRYIDVRNTVRFDEKEGVDQWYDEIHPNNDGFQQVAMRFMQAIDEFYSTK